MHGDGLPKGRCWIAHDGQQETLARGSAAVPWYRDRKAVYWNRFPRLSFMSCGGPLRPLH